MLNSDLKTSFTKKDFDELGVEFSEIEISSNDIRAIRRKTKLSQAVFAKLLNVSPSSVRQWEQGKRTPTGSTKVLLDLLEKSPHVLDYRIKA
jgi:putative transcriptional regulator